MAEEGKEEYVGKNPVSGKSFEELWQEYKGLHTEDAMEKRHKRLKKHTKTLTDIVNDTLGKENVTIEDEKKAHKLVENVIKSALEKENPKTAELIMKDKEQYRLFVNHLLAEINMTYDDLIKNILHSPDITDKERTSALYHLINQAASYSDKEGRKVHYIETEFIRNPAHTPKLQDTAAKYRGISKYLPHITAHEIIKDVHGYHNLKLSDYLEKKAAERKSEKQKAA